MKLLHLDKTTLKVLNIKYWPRWLIHFLFIFVTVLLLKGWPVPTQNELVYHLLPMKALNPGYLINDWTLSEPDHAHYIFNYLIGLTYNF